MPLNVVGSLISAASNVFSGAAQRKHEKEQQAQALKAQKEENEVNRQWQERMWEEHESPQAQVQDMKAAGLNPVGNVGSQSVGSASTSSLPTPSPSQAPQFIARAGEAIANGFHAYRAMKLEQDKATHQVNMDWKKSIQEDIRLAHSREEIDLIRRRIDEEIRDSIITRKDKEVRFRLLEEAVRDGYNNYKFEKQQSDDAHEAHLSQLSVNETIKAYNNARTASEKRNEAYIVAQTAMTYLKNELLSIEKEENKKESKRNDRRFQWEIILQNHKERTLNLMREAQATENEMNEVKLEYAKLENGLYKEGVNRDNWRLAIDKGISHISGAVAYILGGKANNSGPIPLDIYDGWNTTSTR